ncbi:hypothetical protein CBOM_02929 [Ceraceosorus bombacis]|uniref:Cytochrome c oxidase assembly protein n=1 Tax=Ceraceosorus bombacis TaxID=401625 RepID=A0A0P1BG33_9BASI|nr:hypothetical protein CBOM_02929 [Ceraceosorus bombacis]
MSRAAKATLVGSIIVSGLTVWGVHYMQVREARNMHKGVERDTARLAERALQREREAAASAPSSSTSTGSMPGAPSLASSSSEEEKTRQREARALDLVLNREREARFQKLQPTQGWAGEQDQR